jgi:LmbE family N-acetylglucosaminyl deacetylase
MRQAKREGTEIQFSRQESASHLIVPDPASLARAAAEHFVTLATEAIAARGRFAVALSGGSTPRVTYALLATEEFAALVEAARALGLHGNLFTTAEALAGELESVLSTQRVLGLSSRGFDTPSATQPKRRIETMVIMAHPDDAEFTVGGTVAKWAREGKTIVYVICTDGSRGSNDPQVRPQDLVATRRVEQEAAARLLGVEEVVYLRYEDGSLQPTLALRRDLTRVIRRYRPDIVICPDPTVRYYGDSYLNHPDHRAAGDAALDAVSPSANTRYIFPELLAEGLEPHEVRDIYLRGAPEPNAWVDIGDTIELKIAALKKHESQVSHMEGLEEMIRDWAREEAAGQDMTYAEAFRCLTLG